MDDVVDLSKDRIERHIKAMGGLEQACEAHAGYYPARFIVDGVALCEEHKNA